MSKFKILWIDDQPDKIALEREKVESIIRQKGFTPDIIPLDKISLDEIKNDTELRAHLRSRSFDLLFIDFKLSGQVLGSQVISEIRKSNDIFVDIIFYSSDIDDFIKEVIKTYDGTILSFMDDVHIIPLDNAETDEKIERVVDKIIKSWYNVQSVRGVILSQSSKLELKACRLIAKYYQECLTKIKVELEAKGTKVTGAINGKWRKVSEMVDPIAAILKDPINFNWAVKVTIIETMLKEGVLSLQKWDLFKNIFDIRNDFAHNPTKIVNGNLILYKDGKEIIYDESKIEEIMININTVNDELKLKI